MAHLMMGKKLPADGGESRHLRVNDQGELYIANGGSGGPGGATAEEIGNNLRNGGPLPSRAPVGAPNFASSIVTVGTSSVQIAPARPTRVSVTLVNTSISNQTIALTGGGRILAGASLTLPTTAAISGLSSAAGGSVDVFESY